MTVEDLFTADELALIDRELLELAAKAAGISLEWDGPPDKWQPMYYRGKTYHSFDPRNDDGDALRLLKWERPCHDPI